MISRSLSWIIPLSAAHFDGTQFQLKIPNREIEELYRLTILRWFEETIRETNYHHLLKSLIKGDIPTFSKIFEKFFFSAFSDLDVPSDEPRIYHSLF